MRVSLYAVVILTIIGFTIIGQSCFGKEIKTDLQMAIVMFRHGRRTPVEEQMVSFPKYKYRNSSFQPYGVGQLTEAGKEEMYNLGVFLRDRYKTLLIKQDKLDLNEIKMESTIYKRSQESAQLVLAGIKNEGKKKALARTRSTDELKSSYNQEKETLLKHYYQNQICGLYLKGLKLAVRAYMDLGNFKSCVKPMQVMTKKLGVTDPDPLKVWEMYEVFKAQENVQLPLPRWFTKLGYPAIEECIQDFLYIAFGLTKLKKLSGGIYVDMVVEQFKRVLRKNAENEPRLQLYSGHDTTVAAAVAALGGSLNYLKNDEDFTVDIPTYGATIMVELHREKTTRKNRRRHLVKVFYLNGDMKKEQPTQLYLRACCEGKKNCLFRNYVEAVNSVRINETELKHCPE